MIIVVAAVLAAALRVGWLESLDEAGGVGAEPCGEFEDVVEADVALASFHLAYEGPVQSGAFG